MPVATFVGTLSFPFGILSAPVSFPAMTRAELAASIARDLRDVDNQTFTAEVIDDLIRLAFVEVSSIHPHEAIEWVQLVDDYFEYEVEVEDIWRVEIVTPDNDISELTASNGETVGDGWEFYGGRLHLVDGTHFDADVAEDEGDYLRIWGYLPRNPPTEDEDICDLDGPAETLLRSYVKLEAFRSLVSDRSLFGQWAAQPGNSDVSLTQMLGMVDLFSRQWEQRRRQYKRIRRVS